MIEPTIIYLDAGHGGHDPGAIGPGGLTEAEVVLEDCIALRRRLVRANPGRFDIRLTRGTDTFIELHQRAAIVNDDGAHCFLSLHCNAARRPAHGFEVWTSPGQTEADPLATALAISYANEFPGRTFRKDTSDGDPDKEARFTVLTATRCPAVLFELGFIHTPEGEAWFRDTINRDRRVAALAGGIEEYFLGRPSDPPRPEPPIDTAAIRRNARAILDLLPS